ncbi:MAG: hypothetical protein MI745_07670 [Pseudomonadales bacterium]|nr:hypothetical protein [Pseudomonadales bacterium]
MKHLLGLAFLIVIVVLVIIGMTADDPPAMMEADTGAPAPAEVQPDS